jgi:CRISPR/Cas system-associated protein endoribonuclease Cas2
LQNKYKFEKKEQEIKLLEAEKELKDIKLRNSRTWLFILIGSITMSLFFLGLIYFQMTRKNRANKELVRKNREIVKSEEYIRECLKSEQEKKHLSQKQNPEDKYATSSLAEKQKEELKLLITKAMENEKFYNKSDFSIYILSKHLNVSRFHFDTNFTNYHEFWHFSK